MSESPLRGMRVVMAGAVVIVDVLLEAELRRTGVHTVVSCQSPAESVAAYEQEKPDLVLLGVTRASLEEAADAARKIRRDPAACIAAITQNVDFEAETQLRDAGAIAIFKRPFAAKDLVAALEETFRQHLRGRA